MSRTDQTIRFLDLTARDQTIKSYLNTPYNDALNFRIITDGPICKKAHQQSDCFLDLA